VETGRCVIDSINNAVIDSIKNAVILPSVDVLDTTGKGCVAVLQNDLPYCSKFT
jgi:hypothetical protein